MSATTKDVKSSLIIAAIFLLALIVRLPYLGTYLTIDEVKWIEGAGQFLLALQHGDWAQTYWHFFPGITTTWGEAIILWLRWLFVASETDLPTYIAAQLSDLATLVGYMRLSGVLITSAGVALLFPLARRLLGPLAALLGATLLAVDPFFVAHSRIVNGDAVAAIFMLLTALAFSQLWQQPTDFKRFPWGWAVLAGIFAGLALLTKLPAPIIGPWVALLAVVGWWRKRNWAVWLVALLIFGTVSILTFVMLFPAMWVQPGQTLQLIYQEAFKVGGLGSGHDTFFLGVNSRDPGWVFYPVAIAFRLTPITLLGLLALGLALVRNRTWRDTQPTALPLIISLIVYIIFVYGFANLSPKKLDRYLMPVIPPLLLLAGIGWAWLLSQLNRLAQRYKPTPSPRLWQNLMAATLIVVQTAMVIASYPYVLTYYNPLLGGFSAASRLVPVGWGEGMEQAAQWINQQPGSEQARVSSWYGDSVRPYLQTATTSFSSSGKGQLAADYVIFYRNQIQRQKPNQAVIDYFTAQPPLFTVDAHGEPYVWVYQAPAMQYDVSGSNKIVGRATMLGYSLDDPLTPSGDTTLTLFFEGQGTLPANEAFEVGLGLADGSIVGAWSPTTPLTLTPDTIVTWTGTLSLPADLDSGDYRLAVRLLDTNLNSEVTRFPLEDTVVHVGP